MKRTYFVCLFLCLTATFLSSQLKRVPPPSSATQSDSAFDQRGTLNHERRHSGSKISPATTGGITASGDVYCDGDFYSNFSVGDIDVWASVPGYFPEINPAPVLSVSCSVPIEPTTGGSDAGSPVWGGVSLSVTCVVATGVCSAIVDGDLDVYSVLPGGRKALCSPVLTSLVRVAMLSWTTIPTLIPDCCILSKLIPLASRRRGKRR